MGLRVWGSEFRVQGSGLKVEGVWSGGGSVSRVENLVRDNDSDHIVPEQVAVHPLFNPDSPEKNLPPNLQEKLIILPPNLRRK